MALPVDAALRAHKLELVLLEGRGGAIVAKKGNGARGRAAEFERLLRGGQHLRRLLGGGAVVAEERNGARGRAAVLERLLRRGEGLLLLLQTGAVALPGDRALRRVDFELIKVHHDRIAAPRRDDARRSEQRVRLARRDQRRCNEHAVKGHWRAGARDRK